MKNRTVLIMLLAICLAGCDLFEDKRTSVPADTIVEGAFSGVHFKTERIIVTESEWAMFWQLHGSTSIPPPAKPSVDFSTSIVVAIYGGDKPTNGFEVVIIDVFKENETVLVEYRIRDNSGVLQVVTQPHIILKLPKSAGTIRIVERN